MEELKNYLEETDSKHSDMVDSFAYMIASKMAKIRNDYVLLYIKNKPKYIPKFIYKWFIKKFIVIAEFRN